MVLINDVSWEMNFTIMAAFMGVGVVMASLVQEPKQYGPPPKSLAEATVVPFRELFQRRALGPNTRHVGVFGVVQIRRQHGHGIGFALFIWTCNSPPTR